MRSRSYDCLSSLVFATQGLQIYYFASERCNNCGYVRKNLKVGWKFLLTKEINSSLGFFSLKLQDFQGWFRVSWVHEFNKSEEVRGGVQFVTWHFFCVHTVKHPIFF